VSSVHTSTTLAARHRVFSPHDRNATHGRTIHVGQNPPPALQKKPEDAIHLRLEQIHWVLRHEGGTLTCGRAACLDGELAKNGDVPRSPLPENGSLMPSAGTIFNLKIEIDLYYTAGIRRWRSGSARHETPHRRLSGIGSQPAASPVPRTSENLWSSVRELPIEGGSREH
jgi:hypothetical protein